MTRIRLLVAVLIAEVFFVTPAIGQELNRYRGYALESSITSALKVGAARESDIKTLHERPSRIQELEWRAPYLGRDSHIADPVRRVLLRFIDNQLYRIAVTYDSERTEGLTTADIVNSISATYGAPAVLDRKAPQLATADLPAETTPVAQWEGAHALVILTRTSSYQPQFQLVVLSKPLAASAHAAIQQSVRLDKQEAPQRAIDQREKEIADALETSQRTRAANKAAFKP